MKTRGMSLEESLPKGRKNISTKEFANLSNGTCVVKSRKKRKLDFVSIGKQSAAKKKESCSRISLSATTGQLSGA